ncbi:MAG: acyl-CoA dehydrogenase family protein, partial [Methyloligellaceae bacterium]
MDFTLSAEIRDYRDRIRAFVDTHLIPIENDKSVLDDHEMIAEPVLLKLREQARSENLWALQMPKSRGGGELSKVGMSVCYEEMARSPFGPVVFNAAAPDDGNMMILEKVLPEDMKSGWLQPIVDGQSRSSFAMTEPMPGAGSDPSAMLTTARQTNGMWEINGRKHFITGAEGADIFILIAKTSDDPRKGLTAFLHRGSDEGFRIERRIPIMGPEEHGGHCEVVYENLVIPDKQRIMNIGDG